MATARDIAIIIVAIMALVDGIFLAILVWEIWQLIRLLRKEVMPIIDSADETVRTVRGTTTFVSETFVTPLVRVSSFAAGVSQALRILARRGRD